MAKASARRVGRLSERTMERAVVSVTGGVGQLADGGRAHCLHGSIVVGRHDDAALRRPDARARSRALDDHHVFVACPGA